ncbi:MAG: AraC family transcriptional regulator [Caldilineaceae bacterium]
MLGGQEERLGHIAALGGNTHRIVNAIGCFRREYDRNLRMETVAGDLGMSVSSFHHHFKAVATGLSPLQFQKRAGLQEALAPAQRTTGRCQHRLPGGLRRCPPTSAGNKTALSACRPCRMWRSCGRPARTPAAPTEFRCRSRRSDPPARRRPVAAMACAAAGWPSR